MQTGWAAYMNTYTQRQPCARNRNKSANAACPDAGPTSPCFACRPTLLTHRSPLLPRLLQPLQRPYALDLQVQYMRQGRRVVRPCNAHINPRLGEPTHAR